MSVEITGPKPVRPREGRCYMMMVRDDHSLYTRLYILCMKDGAEECFREYIAEIHSGKVEMARSDGGGGF